MTTTDCESEVVSVGEAMSGHAQRGIRRRTALLVSTFELMRKHPGGTLPDKMASPADLRAFYRPCDSDDVTHAAVIEAARRCTLSRIADHAGTVLVLHDATELDDTSITSLADDPGQIGKETRRGYVCQNVLAVAADSGEVLGLLNQILHHSDDVPPGETLMFGVFRDLAAPGWTSSRRRIARGEGRRNSQFVAVRC